MKKVLFTILIIGISALVSVDYFQNRLTPVWVNCSNAVTKMPDSYSKDSELYYLAWIEHGSFGKKAEAARRLLELNEKKELEITEKLCQCQKEQVLKNMMMLNLFDLQPGKYLRQTQALVSDKDSSELGTGMEGTWVKAGEEFEGQEVDFYFDWGAESSLRLLRNGYLSDRGIEILIEVAGSFYSSERAKAQRQLDLFDGIPAVDVSKQRERYDGENPFDPELLKIKTWFAENRGNIYWNSERQRYFVKK